MRLIFFFQAEDGIRDYKVTGVQTCALPICINSIEHFQQLHEGLRAIRTELPKVKRNLRTDQGRTAIDQFGEAVERNLWQLDKMEPEMRIAEQVVGFQKRLTDILSS